MWYHVLTAGREYEHCSSFDVLRPAGEIRDRVFAFGGMT